MKTILAFYFGIALCKIGRHKKKIQPLKGAHSDNYEEWHYVCDRCKKEYRYTTKNQGDISP
jgi:hypothetical protein